MNSLEKEFVPYQEALELKDLGFDEPCFTSFNNKDLVDWWEDPEPIRNSELVQGYITAPTFSQTFRFFREKYNLHYSIGVRDGIWFFDRWCFDGYKTYEEAELACLRKLIEIVKEENK